MFAAGGRVESIMVSAPPLISWKVRRSTSPLAKPLILSSPTHKGCDCGEAIRESCRPRIAQRSEFYAAAVCDSAQLWWCESRKVRIGRSVCEVLFEAVYFDVLAVVLKETMYYGVVAQRL
jgi:hypothetical protein